MDKERGTPGVNALSDMQSATNAGGWDTTAGYVTQNLATGPRRVLKLYQLKLYTRLWNKNLKTACQNTLPPF